MKKKEKIPIQNYFNGCRVIHKICVKYVLIVCVCVCLMNHLLLTTCSKCGPLSHLEGILTLENVRSNYLWSEATRCHP